MILNLGYWGFEMVLNILVFMFGICTGILIFGVIDNKNSILVRLENTRIENYNLKKDIEAKNGLINSLLDNYNKQGLIDEDEVCNIWGLK